MAEPEKAEETTQYADFSDMNSSELPEEIEETPIKEHTAIQYEEPLEETLEEEPQPETSEAVVNKKGEELSPDKDPYWQHKYDTDVMPLKEENAKLRQEMDAIKAQLNPPKKEEELVPPSPPTSDDPDDEIRFLRESREYDKKVHQKEMDEIKGAVQEFKNAFAQDAADKKAQQEKAYQLGMLQTVGGLTPQEAMDALNTFSKDAENPEQFFGDLANFYRSRKGKSATQPSVKSQSVKPLATQPGVTENEKIDESDQFFGDMKGFINRNY